VLTRIARGSHAPGSPAWKAAEATRPISELAAQAADGLSREAPSLTAVSYLIGHGAGMHTAPEAARVIARTLALTCADCTNGGGGSGGRSAHVPDHHLSGLG
jgi:hypothetical protein